MASHAAKTEAQQCAREKSKPHARSRRKSYEMQNIGAPRSEGDANAEFYVPLRDAVGNHAVQPDPGERQGQSRERSKQNGNQPRTRPFRFACDPGFEIVYSREY